MLSTKLLESMSAGGSAEEAPRRARARERERERERERGAGEVPRHERESTARGRG